MNNNINKYIFYSSFNFVEVCEVIKRASMNIPLDKLPNGHQYFKLEVLQNNKVNPEAVKSALEAEASKVSV